MKYINPWRFVTVVFYKLKSVWEIAVYPFQGQTTYSVVYSLILSSFVYVLEVWETACNKYLVRIDNFCKWAYLYGYTAKADFEISTLIEQRDKLLFNKITTRKTILFKICCRPNGQEC